MDLHTKPYSHLLPSLSSLICPSAATSTAPPAVDSYVCPLSLLLHTPKLHYCRTVSRPPRRAAVIPIPAPPLVPPRAATPSSAQHCLRYPLVVPCAAAAASPPPMAFPPRCRRRRHGPHAIAPSSTRRRLRHASTPTRSASHLGAVVLGERRSTTTIRFFPRQLFVISNSTFVFFSFNMLFCQFQHFAIKY